MSEEEIFALIKTHIISIQAKKAKPVRVAINGIEGTGKTVFAHKLTGFLNAGSINGIHVSIDGFHYNKEKRHRQGRDSAKGYYEDSYDENSFVEMVLKSSQTENPNYTPATHDLETDEYLEQKSIPIHKDAVLITDGSYLFKQSYRDHWDLKIYLKTSFEIAMERGISRDMNLLGGIKEAKEKYEQRYHRASENYISEYDPESIADIVFENSDFNDLRILKNKLS